jgi:hypothetical protein
MHDFLSHALVSDEAAHFSTSHGCHILPPLQGCSIKAFANTKFHFLVHASPKDESNLMGLQTILQAFHSGLNGKFTDRKMTMGPISSIQAPTS